MKTGDVVNGYKLQKYIGDGGMASVWKVEKDGMVYAMKVCKSTEEEIVRRFQREFRLMQSINHENVIKVFEQEVYDGKQYFIEELADMDLEYCVENIGLTTKQKYMIAKQICEGLEAIHKSGEIHRDLKPKNILLKGEVAKISDFGIGRFLARDTTTLTMTTDKFGSVAYSAPEVVEKESDAFKQGSPLIDIYALGCLLYFLFSDGSLPLFFNYNMVSADIFPVLSKCREYKPENRYQTAADVKIAIIGVMASKQRYRTMTDLVQNKRNIAVSELSENALSILYNSGGKMELLANFQAFESILPLIGQKNQYNADNIATFILKVFNEDTNYWLQFQDTEIMARMAVLLCPIVKESKVKIDLLRLCLSSAIRANRWDAMRDIHNNLIVKWNESTIKPYESYIRESQDDFYRYANIIGVKLPQLVINIIES